MADVSTRIMAGIPVEVTRKRQKNMYLRVAPDGTVRVSAPTRTSFAAIERFVELRMGWIVKQQAKMISVAAKQEAGGNDDDAIYVWGRPYALEVTRGRSYALQLDGTRACLTAPAGSTPEKREAFMREWYRAELVRETERLLPQVEKMTGLYCNEWRTKYMKTRWGTCNTKAKRIWLNVQLAKYPIECLQYVILHEIAHLAVPDHGPRFAAIMDRYMPTWRSIRKKLNS